MSGKSAVLIKRQKKFKSAIYLNVAAITIAFLLYLERVLRSEAYGSVLHLFIILSSLINCFKSYKSMMTYEAFYKQMNDQYETEMQNAEHLREVHPEFEEFMKLSNEEPEQKTWNSKMSTSISIMYLTLLSTYALTKIFQDYLLDYYNMINNLWLFISFLISMRYLIFDEQNVAECMNQDIRNFKERMEKYISETFSNLLDVKHEIRKDSCHGDVRSKILQNSSKITLEEKKQSSICDKNINHENENSYVSQETTYNKGETKLLNLNTSDCRALEAETSITEKEETAEKSDTDLQVITEQEWRLQLIENMREKDIIPSPFNQDRKEKEIKQNEEHRNSVSKDNIIEQSEKNIRKNSTSDPSTNEVETEVAVKENTLIKADSKLKGLGEQNCPSASAKEDGNIRGMVVKKGKSEMIANWEGEDSEKGTNLSESTQGHREKNIKQTLEQGTLVPDDEINEQRESNKRKSSPSDPSTNEAETDVAEQKTSIKIDDNLQGLKELKNGSEKIANRAGKDSEKDNNLFASPQDNSEKEIKQTKEQRNLLPDDIIEQRERNNKEQSLTDPSTSEAETDAAGEEKVSIKTGNNLQGTNQLNSGSEMVSNGAVKDSEENINFGATPQDHSAKDIKQTKQENIAPDGIIEQRESNNGESSPSDPSTKEAETDAAGEEETSIKTDDNLQGMKELKEQSETIANGAGKDSEKGNNMGASPEDNSEEYIKQTEEQGNLVPDDIIEKRESNNGESSSSDLSTNEAERDTAGEEEFSIKTGNYLPGINELKHGSETVANGAGKYSEKENNMGESSQDNSEKDMKQTEEQENLVPYDIIEQRESNNRESSPSYPSRNEAETDATEEETSIKTDDKLQEMKELKDRSETIVNGAGKDSEKGDNLGASPEYNSEEDIKQTEEQGNLVPDDIIEKRESNNRESSPSDLGINEAETDTAGEEKLSIKTGNYLPGINELKHQSKTVVNGAGKDSEKHINLGTSPQDHSEKDIKQSEEKSNLVPDDIITEQRERIIRETSPSNSSTSVAEIYVGGEEESLRKAHNDIQECSSETIVNVTERFSGNVVDEGATNQGRYEKNNKQNGAQENSISDENIIERKESNNTQSSSSDRCPNKSETVSAGKDQKAPYNIIVRDEQRERNNMESSPSDLSTNEDETDVAEEEKKSAKTDDNLEGTKVLKDLLETIAIGEGKDSGKDINVGALTHKLCEKDIKQTDEKVTLVPDYNINEQRGSNSKESSPSDASTNEAETHVAGEEKTPFKTDDSLKGMKELEVRSETIANGVGNDSGKDLVTSPQENNEKDIKQTEKQGNLFPDNNVIAQVESNNRESSRSGPSTEEAETDVAEEKTSSKADDNLQGMAEKKNRSETIVSGAGKYSEKGINLGASTQDHNAKDLKQTEEQGNLVPEDMIEQRERNNMESRPSDLSTNEDERDIAGEGETSIKTDKNLQWMNELKDGSETIANEAGKNSQKDNELGAPPEENNEKDIKQIEKLGNFVPDNNDNERRESNNSESSPSDAGTNKAETGVAGEEQMSIKSDDSLQEMKELKDRSEMIANRTGKDSEKDNNQDASPQDKSENDIKQTEKQGTLIPDNDIIGHLEGNNRESSPSDPSTKEAETFVLGVEKTSINAYGNLQGMVEKKNRSESVANGEGKDSVKVINLSASPQDHREKDIKQNEEQGNLVPGYNIFEQRESINRESNLSDPSTNMRVIEANQCDNGQSRPSTNEAKENFEGEEETSEWGVNNLKETEAKENPLFSQGVYTEKIFCKTYRAKKRNLYSNIYSKRNFQRRLKDKKRERDVRFVSRREARKRAVELNICPDYTAGVSKSAGPQLESDTSNQMSSKVEKHFHAENVQINSENEISSPAQQCIFEQDANMDTERRLPKSFNSSPCRNRDLQQHINVTVSVNIIDKCKPSVCGEKACEESEVTEVKRISVDTHINKMGEDMPRISGPNTIGGKNYESITPSLSVEDTTESKCTSDSKSATESKCTSDSKSNFLVLNMGSVKNDSHIKVGVSNTDDKKCERNLIKYEWKSELDQTSSNTKEVSEGSGSPDMQTKRMPEQFMESFSIGHDKKKENTSEESFPSNHIASKMEAHLGKREYIGVKAEKSKVFIPSIVTGKYMQRNNANENHTIALNQNTIQRLEGLQEENFADFSQKLTHSGRRAIGTECGQGTDGLCAVKESGNKLKNVIDVKLISVEESSSKVKKREFNSNPSNQKMKCSGSEGEVSSRPSMERKSEKNIKTISAKRRRKKKETSEEVTFSNYAVSNVDKGPKAKESIDTEYGANKQSMHQFIREGQKKYETNEMNVGGEVEHKDATKKKNYTSSKRDNIIRNHKEKGYQHSLTNEVCHHHHEGKVHFSSCCDSVNGNRLSIDKGKSLLTKGNVQRYEANLSVQGGMTTTESTPTKDNFIKQNNEHHVVCSDCQRRKDRKNCTVVLHNETLDLTFKTSKSFEIRCKFRPTRENAKVKKSDE